MSSVSALRPQVEAFSQKQFKFSQRTTSSKVFYVSFYLLSCLSLQKGRSDKSLWKELSREFEPKRRDSTKNLIVCFKVNKTKLEANWQKNSIYNYFHLHAASDCKVCLKSFLQHEKEQDTLKEEGKKLLSLSPSLPPFCILKPSFNS